MEFIHFTNHGSSITLTLLTKQGNTDEIHFKFMGKCFVAGGYACDKRGRSSKSVAGY
ncbi:Uncharacterised protein [Shewanella morhuae]|uniref:Uncharacterized protein n=1 Tax=Shewanella morhuae TaxID=365591 RepID=A0A379ZD39_9GAMM|nr:Uncharacterised protein [Shewanella morhuae]